MPFAGATTNTIPKTLTLGPAESDVVPVLCDTEFYGVTFTIHSMGGLAFTVEILYADQVISTTVVTPPPNVKVFEVPGVFPANTNVPKLHPNGFRVAARITNDSGSTSVFRCAAVFHLNQGAAT